MDNTSSANAVKPLLLLLLVSILNLSSAQISRSPLCNLCVTCFDSKDPPGVIDVNCTDRYILYGTLYNISTWFDSSNVSYPIGKLILKASDLGDLRLQFPFSNLTYLDLSENFIRKIDDSYFAQLQNMKVLILSHNKIENIRPDVFKGIQMDDGWSYRLRSLTTLKLDHNKLHTLDQDLFEHLEERLEILDLSYNSFKVLDLQTTIAIGSIVYLRELYLSFTGLKVLPDHLLHTPKHLKIMDLSGNSLVSVPTGLSEAHGLETLYFNNNPIVNLTKEKGFPNISTLKVLYMCEMAELENIESESLNRLENLEELHICNNMRLSNIDAGALTRVEEETEIWPRIKKLYLQENGLTTLDFHLILHWEKLEALDLRYNPWTCECENQWFVEELMPIYMKIDESMAKDIKCEAPIEMKGTTFYEEYVGNKTLRCLDLYGDRPETDVTIPFGVLVDVQDRTPLCDLCPCNSEPNKPPNINCASVALDNIYNRSYWYDDSNVSYPYPIAGISFKNNNLKVLKTQFPLSYLNLLDLSNNSIKEIGTGIFSQLQYMSELILSNNEIERIDPGVFRGVYNKDEYFPLKSLKILNLKYNKLHSLDGDTFEHIDDLEELILSNNPFKVIDIQTLTAIASLVSLRTLDLSYTQIKILPDYILHTPKYLVELDLSGNNFESIPRTLEDSHALETLYFNNNPIQNLSGLNVFPKILTLKVLYMSNMPVLEAVGSGALSGLEKLENLYLSHNKRLVYVDPNATLLIGEDLQERLLLSEVFMDYNNISYLDSHTFQWNKLQKMDFRGNPWSCDCKNQWLINELMPTYIDIDEMQAKELKCQYPIEMEGLALYDLFQKKSIMRCLDRYGNRPERDAVILIGSLSASLILLLLFTLLVYIYRSKKLHFGPSSTNPRYNRI